MKFPLFLSIGALIIVGAAAAPAADEKAPPNIRVEMQFVAVPEELALPLVGDLLSKDKIEAAHARIQELLNTGKAKLMGWPMVIMHSGQRAVVEAIREVRYATSYDAPAVESIPNVNGAETFTIEPKVDLTRLEGIPSSFETRNTGITLEVEAVLGKDGKTIDLNVVPQHVRFKGFNKVSIEKTSTGGKVIVEQPEFDTMKVTTSPVLRNGERMLLGIFRTDDPPKHLEFFLLKAEVIPTE